MTLSRASTKRNSLERDRLGCGKYATLSQPLRPSARCPPTDHRFSQTLPLFVAISRGRNGHTLRLAERFVILQREADITMLHAAEPAFQTEVISPVPLLRLAPNDALAPIAKLSIAKRTGLHQRGCLCRKAGAWHGPCGGKPISGGTIADLARDGMLALTTINRPASAQLTERGKWFAWTLLRDAVPADRESLLSSELASG